MKTALFLFLTMCLLRNIVAAQSKTYTIKDGSDANKVIAASDRFQYNNFITGQVVVKDGRVATVPLNYNYIVGDVQFINPDGDTLSITDKALIKYITIGNDTFYYDKTYVQLIDGSTAVQFAKSEKAKIDDIKKIGAYDIASSSTSATTYSSVDVAGKTEKLITKEEALLSIQTTYYFGNGMYHFLPATRNNLLKLFGTKQNEIQIYLKENKVRFDSKSDLEKLINFFKTIY